MTIPPQPPKTQNVTDIHSLSQPSPTVTSEECRLKYVDDQTQGVVLRLDTDLQLNQNAHGPRNYHDRHGHLLHPEINGLQKRLNDISDYAKIYDLKLNEKKTKIMSFNFTRNYDFEPKLEACDKQLDVVYSHKLLGMILSSD